MKRLHPKRLHPKRLHPIVTVGFAVGAWQRLHALGKVKDTMFVSTASRFVGQIMPRLPLVALAATALAIGFLSSPAAAQGKSATSRVGFWHTSLSGFTTNNSMYNIHAYIGSVDISNDPVNGDSASYDSYGAAFTIDDPGYDDGMSFNGNTQAVLTNTNSYSVELQADDAYLYVYAFGGIDSLGIGSAQSSTSISIALASDSASQTQISAYDTSYLDDDYYGFPTTLTLLPNQSFTASGSCSGFTSM